MLQLLQLQAAFLETWEGEEDKGGRCSLAVGLVSLTGMLFAVVEAALAVVLLIGGGRQEEWRSRRHGDHVDDVEHLWKVTRRCLR